MRAEAWAADTGGTVPLIATLPDGAMSDWREAIRGIPRSGKPGIVHDTVDPGAEWGGGSDGSRIEVLLHRNRKGRLTGVLYYYPTDFRSINGVLVARAGAVHMWVDPARHGRGVGTALVLEGNRRWPEIDLGNLDLTEGGAALARKVASVRLSPPETAT
jgi:GNAT superfamily N-acetyltransferase